MASYTIEDIELIRRKSGISYQEAVSLLDYHNGNVARALVDLERNGLPPLESWISNSAGRPLPLLNAMETPSTLEPFPASAPRNSVPGVRRGPPASSPSAKPFLWMT